MIFWTLNIDWIIAKKTRKEAIFKNMMTLTDINPGNLEKSSSWTCKSEATITINSFIIIYIQHC